MVLNDMTSFWRRVQESFASAMASMITEEVVTATRPGAVSVKPIVGPDDPDPGAQELRALSTVSVQPGDRVLVLRHPVIKAVLGKLTVRGVSATTDNRAHHASTGSKSTAIGEGASAPYENSTAIGPDAVTKSGSQTLIKTNTLRVEPLNVGSNSGLQLIDVNNIVHTIVFTSDGIMLIDGASALQRLIKIVSTTDNSLGTAFTTAGTRTHVNVTLTGLIASRTYDIYLTTTLTIDANGAANGTCWPTAWIGTTSETMGNHTIQTPGFESTTGVVSTSAVVSGITSINVSARSVWVSGTVRHRGSTILVIAIPR